MLRSAASNRNRERRDQCTNNKDLESENGEEPPTRMVLGSITISKIFGGHLHFGFFFVNVKATGIYNFLNLFKWKYT